MKQCSKCKHTKDDSEFGKQKRKSGTYTLSSWCKSCQSEYKKEHYKKNKDKYLDKAKRQRESDPETYKKYLRDYYKTNRTSLKEKQKEYRETEQGREAVNKAQATYRGKSDYNLKQNARKKVLRALQSGKLIKPVQCESCSEEKELEAHHSNYNKPLDVQWLCKQCHENTHHLNEGHESI